MCRSSDPEAPNLGGGRPLGASLRAPPEAPILLAVDQELGEGATLRVAPELADTVGPLEVGQHEHVEQLGAGSGTERVEALAQNSFELLEVNEGNASTREG
jgi:hypothetical protein